MNENIKQAIVYEVAGKEFLDKGEATAYEKKISEYLSYTFHYVTHSPDLTEGRGYFKEMIIAVKGWNKNIISEYLVGRFKHPLVFVQGCSPIDNWIIHEGKNFEDIYELVKFIKTELNMGIGDCRRYELPELAVLDESAKTIDFSIEL